MDHNSRTYAPREISAGYHPDGFRIDRAAPPLYFYTRWRVSDTGEWSECRPVDFGDLPLSGWIRCNGFVWEGADTA